MYKIPLAELKEKIVASGKLDAAGLDERIRSKINELSGLISEEGATHIIANELGVEVVAPDKDRLKVKEIYAGMAKVNTLVKVIQKYEVREFNSNGRAGKVCSLFVGDDTGVTRLVFWNDQVDQLGEVVEGSILLVKEAYARDNRGRVEVHMGRNGTFTLNPEGESVEVIARAASGDGGAGGADYSRKSIGELGGGEEGVELLGTIVQVFDPRFFFLCPECNKRASEGGEGGAYTCAAHGAVSPVLSYVLNAIVDDGSGNIRGVFWKNQTNNLLKMTEEDLSSYRDNPASFEDIKTELLGEQVLLMGRVKKNEMFNRLEFSVQRVAKADAGAELARARGE